MSGFSWLHGGSALWRAGGVLCTMVVDGCVGVRFLTRRVGAMHLLSRFQSLES